jgi:hypothetical protein
MIGLCALGAILILLDITLAIIQQIFSELEIRKGDD